MRDIWLLRLRALLARAHGDETRYRENRDRYRDMARTLGCGGISPGPRQCHDGVGIGLRALAGLSEPNGLGQAPQNVGAVSPVISTMLCG
jgi:hypothetical protein